MKVFLLIFVMLIASGCSNSSVIDSSSQPSWFALGGEVYNSSDRIKAQKENLSFGKNPRWFGIHKAKPKIAAIPLEAEGVSITFDIITSKTDNKLIFSLKLVSSERDLLREIEHRWTNTLPFLFAFYINGHAFKLEKEGFFKIGGMNSQVVLVEKGKERSWHINVDPESLNSLFLNGGDLDLSIIAAFSEVQHIGEALHAYHYKDNDLENMSKLVIRSEPASLIRKKGKWLKD